MSKLRTRKVCGATTDSLPAMRQHYKDAGHPTARKRRAKVERTPPPKDDVESTLIFQFSEEIIKAQLSEAAVTRIIDYLRSRFAVAAAPE